MGSLFYKVNLHLKGNMNITSPQATISQKKKKQAYYSLNIV